MKVGWAGIGESSDISRTREGLLLDLLRKATDFYEDIVGMLSGIYELSEYVRRGSPEEHFYSYIVQVLIRESRCENASVFIVEGGRVILKAAGGADLPREVPGVSMELGTGVAGTCALTGEPILVPDVRDCEYFSEFPNSRVEIGSMLCIPIKDGDRTIGVLNLSHSRPNFFSLHYQRIFELLGMLVGQMLTLIQVSAVFQKRNLDLSETLIKKDESLRSLSESYKTVVDASEDCIFILDGDDTVTFCNQRLTARMGKIPARVQELFDAETIACICGCRSGMSPGQFQDFERTVVFGETPGVVGRFFIKALDRGQALVMMRDITAARRLEQRVMQTEKLTSLGLLTSGIAHELNNRLTPILGFADLINARRLGEKDRKRLSIIIDAANSSRSILDSLLKFSRNKPPEKVVFDMRDIIRRVMNLYTPTVKKRGIRLVCDEGTEALFVKADMNCMEQVMVNFINNAIDAIGDEKGTIWIRAGLDGGYVDVSIEDTGPGIPEEIITRVFDPFFTTKTRDKGTGLGLSICYGIVSDHKGEITLENTSRGALARVRIPAMTPEKYEGPPAPGEGVPSVSSEIREPVRRPVIMVVEDEEDLQELMVDTLSPYYEVRIFNNGRHAIDGLHEHQWELIISDLRMPVMDGMEFYHAVVKEQPRMKQRFLFITGDTYDLQVKEFLESTGAVFLRKPFRIKDLRDEVSRRVNSR
ncbi:MAG: ATP-binding protein [Desulfomonilia bacterium]